MLLPMVMSLVRRRPSSFFLPTFPPPHPPSMLTDSVSFLPLCPAIVTAMTHLATSRCKSARPNWETHHFFIFLTMSELYGIDREIYSKIQSKYSVENETKARAWIESIIEEPFHSDDFYESLRDGVVLCKLMNKLAPGSGKYKVSTIPFMQMENIARFLEGAEKLGVPKHDLFQTVDLYEKKNMTQVVDAIFSISRYAYKAGVCSTYLGPKLADKQSNTFSQEQLNESNTIYSTFQYGYNKGANQSGMTTFGARRQISGDKY